MDIMQERLDRAKCKRHFKEWATTVRSSNMAYRIPEALIDTLDDRLDRLVNTVLAEELKLTQRSDGFWERRDYAAS